MRKIALYILAVICVAYIAREFIYYGLRKNKSGEFEKLTTIFIRQNNYDGLIIGSSRAESHFVPRVMDSLMHTSCYNAGLAGASPQLSLAALRAYISHSKTPSFVVFNIDLNLLDIETDTVRSFPKYFPFLGNDAFYQDVKRIDPRFRYFKWLPFYSLPYMNDYYLSNAMHGWMGIETEHDHLYEKGFIPELVHVDSDLDQLNYQPQSIVISDKFKKCFTSLVKECSVNDVKLILVITPLYVKESASIADKAELISDIRAMATFNNLPLFDYTTDDICNHKEYFSNPRHLNKKGAILFTTEFAGQLSQYLR